MKKTIQTPVAIAVLVNEKNQVLLALRNDPKSPMVHNKWELPGGEIEFGEKPDKAALRELYEETGYRARIERLIPYVHSRVWEYEDYDQHVVLISYLCSPTRYQKRRKNTEIIKVQWFSKEETHKLDALPGLKEIIDAAGV